MADIMGNFDRYSNPIKNQEDEKEYTVQRNMRDSDNIAFNNMQSETANPEVDELFQDTEPNKDTSMLHMALAGAGMVPGVGIVADMFDAALYGLEGDIAGAGLSLISAIPALGLVSGSSRIAKSIARMHKVDPSLMGKSGKGASRNIPQQVPRSPENISRWDAPGPTRRAPGPGGGITGELPNVPRAPKSLAGDVYDEAGGRIRYPGIKKMEEDFMKKVGDFGEAARKVGRGEVAEKIDDLILFNPDIGDPLKKATVERLTPERVGGAVKKALSGLEVELKRITNTARRVNIDEDRMAEIAAFIKGNDAVRAASRSGNVGGESLLAMQGAVARGARLFYALDSHQQNEIMRGLQEGDDFVSEPIEI